MLLRCLVLSILVLVPAGVMAQAPNAVIADQAATRLKAMRDRAEAIHLFPTDRPRDPAALAESPLVRYDDPPRGIHDATLWSWGAHGERPLAILKVEHYPAQIPERRWVYGLVSLSPTPVKAEGNGWAWSSTRPGVALRAVPNAPAPAATEGQRLTQLKAMARRFTASEYAGQARGRLQLRLQPRPIHRYGGPQSGVTDGAIFSFAYGTNPDVLLLFEARATAGSDPKWEYGLARLGGGETAVDLDGTEVWTQPYADPPARLETYMNQRDGDGPAPKP